jgi:hypothetical protein
VEVRWNVTVWAHMLTRGFEVSKTGSALKKLSGRHKLGCEVSDSAMESKSFGALSVHGLRREYGG